MRCVKKGLAVLLICMLILLQGMTVFAAMEKSASDALFNTRDYLLKTVKNPQVDFIGGEWAVMALARLDMTDNNIPKGYFDTYYQNLVKTVQDKKGILEERKYTTYSRVVLALTAIGKDPTNVGGYNLLEKLGDYDKVIWQGINGSIFALLALDSGKYDVPTAKGATTQATRQMYVDDILSKQLSDGGFALSGTKADPDITGMALQALAKYQNQKKVKDATEKALNCISKIWKEEGTFATVGTPTSESVSQVLMGLMELRIDLKEARFVRSDGRTILDALLDYYIKDNGFKHTDDAASGNAMATEQAFYALVNYARYQEGKTTFYDMSDVAKTGDDTPGENTTGLPGKHKDVSVMPIKYVGKTFDDIKGHKNRAAIEALAERGIINGMTERTFQPDKTMTRAEFATIITRGLGFTPNYKGIFKDIEKNKWYASYIDTAYAYGIVKGLSATVFAPENTITREEALVMIARAAKLCGMNTDLTAQEVKDMLAQFEDYRTCSSWAQDSIAFCYKENILSQDEIQIQPKVKIKRCEIAEILYQMLSRAKLVK